MDKEKSKSAQKVVPVDKPNTRRKAKADKDENYEPPKVGRKNKNK